MSHFLFVAYIFVVWRNLVRAYFSNNWSLEKRNEVDSSTTSIDAKKGIKINPNDCFYELCVKITLIENYLQSFDSIRQRITSLRRILNPLIIADLT